MAIMCFEKAGERNWEKRAKAASLREAAYRMRDSNPNVSCTYLREAAEIFESIGRFESAAECFCDLNEYELAGINFSLVTLSCILGMKASTVCVSSNGHIT